MQRLGNCQQLHIRCMRGLLIEISLSLAIRVYYLGGFTESSQGRSNNRALSKEVPFSLGTRCFEMFANLQIGTSILKTHFTSRLFILPTAQPTQNFNRSA